MLAELFIDEGAYLAHGYKKWEYLRIKHRLLRCSSALTAIAGALTSEDRFILLNRVELQNR